HVAVTAAHGGTADDVIAIDLRGTDVAEVSRGGAPQAAVAHPVVPHAVLFELRVVEIDDAAEALVRPELQDAHQAVPRLLAGGDAGLEALLEHRALLCRTGVGD